MDLIMFNVTVKELFFAEGIIIVKFWIYENHMCELRSEELNEGLSSQLYTQLLQLRKETLINVFPLRGVLHCGSNFIFSLVRCYLNYEK